MDSSDSLKLDEDLARFLAAYDQELEGGDGHAPTIQVHFAPLSGSSITTDSPDPGALPDGPAAGGGRPGRGDPGLTLPLPTGAPHRVGRFELRRQLGKGGCGIVFLAYDPRMRREVALKVPRPEMLMNQDAKRRLQLEALAASEFDHPNLVPVYEWGEVGPICFIATAFCSGQTLADWLDRQAFPVPVRQAARFVCTVAEAVQHAHDRGVLHRDLKPNNVILQEMKMEESDEPPAGSVQMRGEYYVPRVVDFGLAKLSERGGPSETGTRQILGTPKYMAPEQAQARREDIGPPADVYALGVVLYELLAGRAPYDGASDVEVLRQSVEGKPVPPRHLRPDVPRDLEAICLKAMARVTGERYRTAIDFADDLRRFLDGRPTVARPLAWSGRAARWLRRNDQLVAIAVLGAIALLVTLLGTWNSYKTRNLQTVHDGVLRDQADRNRTDQQREYVRQVRDAYHAWRGGNGKAAADALDTARRAAEQARERPEFAHDYLAQLVRGGQLVIVCPAGPVTVLAVSPDGARLASGHADGTAAVWDRATGAPLGSVPAHTGAVTHLAFALGGRLLVTVGPTGAGPGGGPGAEALGWAVDATGAVAPAQGAHRALGAGTSCMTVTPDGTAVLAGDAGGSVHKVSLTDPALSRTARPAPGDPVRAVGCSPNGDRVVIATANGRVVRLSPALAVEGIDERSPGITALAVLADGRYDVGLQTGGIAAFRGSVYSPQVTETGERVYWIAASAHGYAANTAPGRVRLGARGELNTGDVGAVRAGVFAPDGKTLFTGAGGLIRSWTFPAVARDSAVVGTGRVTAIGVHPGGRPDGDFVVATDGGLTAFTGDGAAARRDVGPAPQAFRVLQHLDDGAVVGVVFRGREVAVRSTGPGQDLFRAAVPGGRAPTSAALVPDGSRLAVGDSGGGVTVWGTSGLEPVGRYDTGHRGPVGAVALADDGRLVAARTATGLSVWTVGAADPLATVPADDQAVFRFLPAGDRIAVAGRDGVVRVWSTGGREELTLFGHVGRVTGLGVSPDGRTLVSGCSTGEVKFWDLKAGMELFGVGRHSVAVTAIEFAADGRYMVTGGDGQIAVWDAR